LKSGMDHSNSNVIIFVVTRYVWHALPMLLKFDHTTPHQTILGELLDVLGQGKKGSTMSDDW